MANPSDAFDREISEYLMSVWREGLVELYGREAMSPLLKIIRDAGGAPGPEPTFQWSKETRPVTPNHPNDEAQAAALGIDWKTVDLVVKR